MRKNLVYSLILSILSLLLILVLLSCQKLTEAEELESNKADECVHEFSEWIKISIATCVKEGKQVRTCLKCNLIQAERLEILPHDAKRCKTVPATCSTEGYLVYLCECGYTYNSDYVVPLGHSLIKEKIVLKTCAEPGYTHYQCERCNYNFDSDFIPQSHEFVTTITYPSATKNGFSTHTCKDCSYHYDNNFIKYKDILPSPYLQSSVPLCKGIDIYEKEHETSNGVYLPIDWKSIKAQGYDFVILKVGSKKSGKSPTFDMDYAGAKAAGLGVGAYYYAYSSTVGDTIKDAQDVLTWISGKQFEYPIYFDIEDPTLENLPQVTLTNIVTAFIEELQSNGYYSALYANNKWLVEILDTQTMLDRFDIWYARYPQIENPVWNEQKYGKQLSMWQFTDKGVVNGFSDEIDINYSYRDYPALMKKWGLNGFDKVTALG